MRETVSSGEAAQVFPPLRFDALAEGGSGYHLFEKSVERVTLRLAPS